MLSKYLSELRGGGWVIFSLLWKWGFYHFISLRVHILDDKSTAQTKVQIQIVEQLEQQLQKVSKTIWSIINDAVGFLVFRRLGLP